MAEIIDKVILLLFGCVLMSRTESFAAPVVALLLGIATAALGNIVSNPKCKSIYILGYVVGCFFLPELFYFLPIIFYDCAMNRRMWLWYGTAPVLVVFYGTKGQMELFILMLCVALFPVAAILGQRTGRIEQLEHEMIRLRDTSTELNLVLREKNKNLMEKQDYEIYLATLRERNRIAREIHDNVGHMLSRSILQVGALATVHKEEPLHGQLTSVNETLNQAMNSIRESVHDLHDDSIDLRQAITEATREMRQQYQLTVDYDMSPDVPKAVKYCFITTVKEAMSNIAKHSNASSITLIMREHPGFYQLTVEDNGTKGKAGTGTHWGEDTVQMDGSEGIGLSNMRERVEALSGTFRIHTEKGFVIFISIPKTGCRQDR